MTGSVRLFATGEQNENGSPDTQAGSHPYSFTTTFLLNEATETRNERYIAEGNLRDARVQLPPGFVGDPDATPRCAQQEFIKPSDGRLSTHPCPNETAVGLATIYVAGDAEAPYYARESIAVYNLAPPNGVAAQFGFIVKGLAPVFLNINIRTGGDYGLTVVSPEITQTAAVIGSKVTIWGVPAAPGHDKWRGSCLAFSEETFENGGPDGGSNHPETGFTGAEAEQEGSYFESHEECPDNAPAVPLLTNPTSCGTPRTSTVSVDSWENPGSYLPDGSPDLEDPNWKTLSASLPELSGCEELNFGPTVGVTPDGTAGSTPTGLNVDLHVPQGPSENPLGLAEADVKDTTVALPAGAQTDPSAADGLQSCSTAQIGFERFEELPSEPGVQTALFTPGAPSCPDASKIANVSIATPLLEHELKGSVYLAAPQNFAGPLENPFGSLVALYLVAEEPERGVLIKLAGKVVLDETTGQLTTTFENTPQLPFSDLKLVFFGTDRAPLATPALCRRTGEAGYQTVASFAPWGGQAQSATSEFFITSGPEVQTASGPEKMPCPNPPGNQSSGTLPFSPSLSSGMPNINAGVFSSLTTTLSREDGQQSIQQVTLHYPAGLSGILSGVELCGEAQANAGTCGPGSEIGETIVSVGLGGDPFSVTGGKVYLTGPYDSAPFGLSIENPAKAGPFDLQEGRPVVVRAKIEVNPLTAALTITTDASGEHAIPHIIDGIPLQIKHVNVNITRPGFTFNPTNCDKTAITGSVTSTEGASANVSIPFQVTNCASLAFAPKFSASTSGKTSRLGGASLSVNLAYPKAPFGSQANIKQVKVELPKQLPSRLTTLQKACTAAQFDTNPSVCPADSIVGHAKAITSLIPVALEGPAYFVSNGGEAYPNLILVLQGYGVTIDLIGDTHISKAGINSSTFKTVPDAPVGSFQLTLPEGRYSALAALGNLCKQKLTMPTEMIAQNGAEIHESTKIAVIGCSKAKRTAHKKKAKARAHRRREGGKG